MNLNAVDIFHYLFLGSTAHAHCSLAKFVSNLTRRQPAERDIHGPLINLTPAVAAQVYQLAPMLGPHQLAVAS